MANMSNDETVWAIPSIQCPSCGFTLDLSGTKVEKLSKAQRRKMDQDSRAGGSYSAMDSSDPEMNPSVRGEHTFVLVSCSNHRCEQYNRFKVLRIPKIVTAAVKVSLE